MWAPNKAKQEPFLSHSIWEKLFSPLFWRLCSREEENRRDAGNTTIQAQPWHGRGYTTSTTHHCAQHPATGVIHSAQSAAQTTCEHKHCVYNKRAQRRQWKCNAKKKKKLQGCRNGAEITAFERNVSFENCLYRLILSWARSRRGEHVSNSRVLGNDELNQKSNAWFQEARREADLRGHGDISSSLFTFQLQAGIWDYRLGFRCWRMCEGGEVFEAPLSVGRSSSS